MDPKAEKRRELLVQFQMRLRKEKPILERLLHKPDGSAKQALDGINDIAKEVGFPRKITTEDVIRDVIVELWPYIERFRE